MANVINVDGKKMVALRSALEEMGGKVSWDNDAKQASIELNGRTTVVTMADENAEFDGSVKTLSSAPLVKDGVLYVPEDFFPAILYTQMPFSG